MNRTLKILLAWLEEKEAIAALRGFRMPEPGTDVSEQTASFKEKRASLHARPPYQVAPASIEPLPAHLRVQEEAILDSLLPQAIDEKRDRYSLAVVNLAQVISFQKAVALEVDDRRFKEITLDNFDALFALCLPQHRVEEELSGTLDRDGRGITISSINPNLRVGSMQTIEVPGAKGVKMIGFPVVFGPAYVHVVEYKGRLFLKDGYHRCHGLLLRGITRVPVVLLRGNSFSEVNSGGTTVIAAEHVLGSQPPMLTDFLDPTVSATVSQQAFRKAIRINAEDFVINL